MFTDDTRSTAWEEIRQRDLRAFQDLLTTDLIVAAARSAGVRVGTNALNVLRMTWLAIASAMRGDQSFLSLLGVVLEILRDVEGSPNQRGNTRGNRKRGKGKGRRSRHSPRASEPTQLSEEAFAQARQRVPTGFWMALLLVLGERFESRHRSRTTWKHFRLLALDGTCVKLRDWRRLTEYFGTVGNGKGKRTTQARMVMLQLPLVRLPWRYELVPVKEGERTVAGRLLKGIRANDLVLMDRGFWSYGLFWQIQRQEGFFAIRRFASAKLRVVRRLGRGDCLVDWAPSDRQWRDAFPPSMRLRLIAYQVKGFRPTQLVTNILDPGAVSRAEMVRLSTDKEVKGRFDQGLYHRRWEIETTFFELKVGQGMAGNLRSRTPQSLAFEIAGHVLYYFLVRWLIVVAAEEHKLRDPLEVSFAAALQAISQMDTIFVIAKPRWAQDTLVPRLRARLAATVVPYRPGRHYPRPHDTKIKNKGGGKIALPSKLPMTCAQA